MTCFPLKIINEKIVITLETLDIKLTMGKVTSYKKNQIQHSHVPTSKAGMVYQDFGWAHYI